MRSFNKIFITITGLALFLSVGLTLGLQNRATKSQPVPTEGAFSQASGIGAWTDVGDAKQSVVRRSEGLAGSRHLRAGNR